MSRERAVSPSGAGDTEWTRDESIPWMALGKAGGTGDDTVVATVDRSVFAPGTYHGQIVFAWDGGTRNITVTLRV